jgi:hypothetical protein
MTKLRPSANPPPSGLFLVTQFQHPRAPSMPQSLRGRGGIPRTPTMLCNKGTALKPALSEVEWGPRAATIECSGAPSMPQSLRGMGGIPRTPNGGRPPPFDSPQKPGCPILRASCEGWEPEAAKDAFREIISILKDLSNRHPDRYSAALTNAESTLAQIEKETEKR